MTIEEYFGDWSKVIDIKNAESILRRIANSKEIICPKPKDVYKAFKCCPFNKLRVVILGQDPYNNLKNNEPVATGIAFANVKETCEDSYSPSLNVLKESIIDFTLPHGIINFDPSLEKWEEQGVLMLNTALTCLAGKAGSHTLVWIQFIRNLLANLSKQLTGIVYVLMGSNAEAFEPCINKQFNHILKTKHPAWYARTNTPFPKDLWRDINKILIGQNGYGIQWYKEYN